MSDLPGSNSLSNLSGLAKVTYPDKPKKRTKYAKVMNLLSGIKKEK